VFSRRVPDDRTPNRLARALEAASAFAKASADKRLLDLTLSNPTRAGIVYPPHLLAPLADATALTYRPEPFGMRVAREAVAATYTRRGLRISPDRIVLTASTSEAYSLLFKLLCEPKGSAVLTPVPSYPLFDHLTRLDGVEAHRYPLEFHGTWSVSTGDVERAWTPDTRALLAVSPNNPTGSVIRDPDADGLAAICADNGGALIVDEVFHDFPLGDALVEPRAFDRPSCLLFRLGGLSKSAGLPQVKLGWIAVAGPDDLVTAALERLEWICDTYLSVSTPAQIAAASLIDAGGAVRDQILARIRANYGVLRARVAPARGTTVLPADAGWSAVLRVPATRSEEEMALDLLERDRLVVHPGYFFDFPHEAFLVVSLLPEPDVFAAAIDRLLERVDAA
jgi:alanine-synthesizing transaminase